MLEKIFDIAHLIIGINAGEQITCMQMITRGIIIYLFGIVLVRLHERFFGLKTTHDILLRITIAAIFANTIIGRAPFLCSLLVTLSMVLFNWLIAIISFRSHKMEKFIKGSHYLLVDNGKILWKNMRQFYITKDELLETARITAHTEDLNQIDKAYLENDGEITIILRVK